MLWLMEKSAYSRNVRRIGQKKIYLLTDAGSDYSDDKLAEICSGFRDNGIELAIM